MNHRMELTCEFSVLAIFARLVCGFSYRKDNRSLLEDTHRACHPNRHLITDGVALTICNTIVCVVYGQMAHLSSEDRCEPMPRVDIDSGFVRPWRFWTKAWSVLEYCHRAPPRLQCRYHGCRPEISVGPSTCSLRSHRPRRRTDDYHRSRRRRTPA